MSNNENENVSNMLKRYIKASTGETIAADLLLRGCPDIPKESWDAFSENPSEFPCPINENTIQKKHKFASLQLLKYYQLTYALQVKLGLGKTSKQTDKVWVIKDGNIQEIPAAETKDDTSIRINKNDLNAIRGTYEEQLTKELPKLIHKIYVEFMSVKNNFSYNANEVKLVLMDSTYLTAALNDVNDYVTARVGNKEPVTFANNNMCQRNYLMTEWFLYENPTGKSTEKIGSFFKKLLNSTIAKLAKSVSQLKKEVIDAGSVDDESARVISHIYAKYLPSFPLNVLPSDVEKNFTAMSEDERRSVIVKISSDALHSKLKTAFENGAEYNGSSVDYSKRRDVICDVRDLATTMFVNAKAELVHIDTIDQMKSSDGGDENSIKMSFTTFTEEEFSQAILYINNGGVEMEDSSNSEPIGSDRLNTAIFKAITANNVFTAASGKRTRKKFSLELESAFFNPDSESFSQKIKHINKRKTHTSSRGERTSNENALVISDDLWRKLGKSSNPTEKEFHEIFADAHHDTDFGLLQRGAMYLSSASKLHASSDSKSVVSAFSVSSFADKDLGDNKDSTDSYRELLFNNEYSEYFAKINIISFVIAVYANCINGGESKLDSKPSSSMSVVSSNAASAAREAREATREKRALKSRMPASSSVDNTEVKKSPQNSPQKGGKKTNLGSLLKRKKESKTSPN